MKSGSLLTLLVAFGIPITTSKNVVVEERSLHPNSWKRSTTPINPDLTLFTLHVGLQQQNLHLLDDELNKVSNPESEQYGQHWSPLKVKEFFQPSKESVDSVSEWLRSAGHHEHALSPNAAWISVEMTVGEAEALLDTKYRRVENPDSNHETIACDSYSVPDYVRDHIELIKPTLHYDQPTSLRQLSQRRDHQGFVRTTHNNRLIARNLAAAEPKKRIKPTAALKQGQRILEESQANISSSAMTANAIHAPADQLAACVNATTILCVQTLYGINYTPTGKTQYGLGVVEYPPQNYVPSDLDHLFASYTQLPAGLRPDFISLDGASLNFTYDSFANNGESNLDLTYAIGLAYPLPVTLYEAGTPDNSASFNNLLDAIDKSFCLYLGGDDPNYDAVYTPQGCGNATRPEVLSTSYAYNEFDLTAFYMSRQCNEYGKLGLLGTTILYSSGDFGVGGSSGQCFVPGTIDYADPKAPYQRFNPSFPASCPYVTGVGATQIAAGKLASDPNPEIACSTIITSGGGFSDVFSVPSWQASAMRNYYANYAPPYNSSQYNNSMVARGFPDISANGANYITSLNGSFYKLYGTSASTPVLAAIIALINDARHAHGKGSVGFINPALYSNAFQAAINDITVGGNAGCGGPGFKAVPGWDPVVGLGTPKFQQLKALWMGMK